jgi:hypothetical protein
MELGSLEALSVILTTSPLPSDPPSFVDSGGLDAFATLSYIATGHMVYLCDEVVRQVCWHLTLRLCLEKILVTYLLV